MVVRDDYDEKCTILFEQKQLQVTENHLQHKNTS